MLILQSKVSSNPKCMRIWTYSISGYSDVFIHMMWYIYCSWKAGTPRHAAARLQLFCSYWTSPYLECFLETSTLEPEITRETSSWTFSRQWQIDDHNYTITIRKLQRDLCTERPRTRAVLFCGLFVPFHVWEQCYSWKNQPLAPPFF